MAKKRKKQKFQEPAEGWFFHPSGDMCMSCTKLDDNCSALKFNEMGIVLETYEGTKMVKCEEHIHGTNAWTERLFGKISQKTA